MPVKLKKPVDWDEQTTSGRAFLNRSMKMFTYSQSEEDKTMCAGTCVVNVLCFLTRTTMQSSCFVALLFLQRHVGNGARSTAIVDADLRHQVIPHNGVFCL